MGEASYAGRCACGSVRYESSAAPLRMFNCHCLNCQRASGSAYSPVLLFRRDAVQLAGDVRYYPSISERGTVLDRGFCPTCGNPVSMLSKANAGICLVYASTLDDPKLYKPSAEIWTRSAQPWDKIDQSVPCFETALKA